MALQGGGVGDGDGLRFHFQSQQGFDVIVVSVDDAGINLAAVGLAEEVESSTYLIVTIL